MNVEERFCPRCKYPMEAVEDSEWHLGDVESVDIRCPRCGYKDTVVAIVVERSKAKYSKRRK